MTHFKFLPLFCCVILTLSACSYWNNSDTHRVICNKLKSDIVFNGATSITRQADIQRSEKPLQEHTYDANGCS